MKREFIVALRNDRGQLLVLETVARAPVFPRGVITDAEPLKKIAAQLQAETGLVVGGLHLASVGKDRPGIEVHRFTAHVASGVLVPFPTTPQDDREGFHSASWIAPSLVVRLKGASSDMLELIADLARTYTRPGRP